MRSVGGVAEALGASANGQGAGGAGADSQGALGVTPPLPVDCLEGFGGAHHRQEGRPHRAFLLSLLAHGALCATILAVDTEPTPSAGAELTIEMVDLLPAPEAPSPAIASLSPPVPSPPVLEPQQPEQAQAAVDPAPPDPQPQTQAVDPDAFPDPKLPRRKPAQPRPRPAKSLAVTATQPPPPVAGPATAPADAVASAPTPTPDAGSQSAAAEATWLSSVHRALVRVRRYPPRALARGQEGVVHLRLAIARDGALVSASIRRASGSEILDAEAAALPGRAAPFPPPPESVDGNPVELFVPIAFDLAHGR